MDGVARVAKEGGDGRVAGRIEEEDSADEAEGAEQTTLRSLTQQLRCRFYFVLMLRGWLQSLLESCMRFLILRSIVLFYCSVGLRHCTIRLLLPMYFPIHSCGTLGHQ